MKMSEDPALWPKKISTKKRVLIICPVRNAKPEVVEFLVLYVKDLEENKGCLVYWPYRDNPYQKTDAVGLDICSYNRRFLIEADEIHIYYDPESGGSTFDLGMLFMRLEIYDGLRIKIINLQNIGSTSEKSFSNFLLALNDQFGIEEDRPGDS